MIPDVTPTGVFYLPSTGWLTSFYNPPSWIYLLIAGIFEVVWATTMKLSNGFSILSYSLTTLVGIAISFGSLVLATKNLSLSIAYSIWTGIGAVGNIIVGVVLFHDQFSAVT